MSPQKPVVDVTEAMSILIRIRVIMSVWSVGDWETLALVGVEMWNKSVERKMQQHEV